MTRREDRPVDGSRRLGESAFRIAADRKEGGGHKGRAGQQGEFDIFTFGADNQPGGEGINADIGNWNIR